MIEREICPGCGHVTERYKNPYPTADVIVDIGGKYRPYQFAASGVSNSGGISAGAAGIRSTLA